MKILNTLKKKSIFGLNHYLFVAFISSIAILSSYLLYARFSRFTNDDYGFLTSVRNSGPFENFLHSYFGWEGAFSNHITYQFILKLADFFNTPFVVHMLSLGCFIWASTFLIKALFGKVFQLDINLGIAFLLSTIMFGEMYYNGMSVGDVWFWMVGQWAYVFNFSLILLLISGVISGRIKHVGLLFAAGVIITGYRINFNALLFVTIFLVMIQKGGSAWLTKKQWVWLILGLIIGTTVYVIAPGNYVRLNGKESIEIFDLVGRMTASLGEIIVFRLKRLPFTVCFLAGSLLAGTLYQKKIEIDRKKIILFFLINVVVTLTHIVVIHVARGYNVLRSMVYVDFFWTIFWVACFFMLGGYLNSKLKTLGTYVRLASLGCFMIAGLLSARRYVVDHESIQNFANNWDQREELLKNLSCKSGDEIMLEPLPASGWIHSKDLGSKGDVNYVNENMETYFNLNCKLYVIEAEINKP